MSSPLRKRRERAHRNAPAIAAVILEILAKQRHRTQGPGGRCKAVPEREALVQFCQEFQHERNFSQHALCGKFTELLQLLQSQRVTESWLGGVASEDHAHSTLLCLRILLRDDNFQQKFLELGNPIPVLAKMLSRCTQAYFSGSQLQGSATTDLLKELTNIFQKLSNLAACRGSLVECGVHCELVRLLSSRDLLLLQCALCALTNLCKSPSTCEVVGSLHTLPPLLHILHTYDSGSRRLASDLLLLLSQSSSLREQARDSDALPSCLRALHSEDLHTLHRMVGVLERFAEDSELREEIRLLGGIPLILALFSKRDGSSETEREEKTLALHTACCSTITQLVLDDANAQHIVQGNGVYLLSSLILLPAGSHSHSRARENLQKHAFRALRYLFSMERNRQLFKQLFPPQFFETFIDIGHYVRDLAAYTPLLHMINSLPESEVAVIQSNIEAANHSRAPIFTLGGYAVLELLGSGAFGSVYKVKKKHSDVFYAMKEIKATHPGLGRTVAERSASIGRLLNEVNIMREQLRHPNVVHYHKCFQEGGHLYIIMELIEGAPLSEHITSLQEKGLRFSEQRIWKIFTQLVLALRYIHMEKRVIHRDLTPANIMLSEGDRLTITDFGLAKQKQKEFSVMKSVVGTMTYWCPELVQSEPYNEKADIWAAGCILYQLATLRPPFHSSNMLALAKKIAEVDYEPIPNGPYSSLISQVVQRCLTANPSERPDSVELGALISGVMMQQMDQLALQADNLEKRLAKERQRTIRHFNKAVWSEQRYQQLLTASESTLPNPTRRRLSASFGYSCSPAGRREHTTDYTNLGEQESPPVRPRERVTSTDGEFTDGTMSDTDSLQRSTDSVFLENIPDETDQMQFPPRGDLQPANSPSRSRPKENPLTSRTNRGLRLRSQSAVVSGSQGFGLEQFQALQGRTTSAFVSSRGPSPHSPLTHKARTPSVSSLLGISPRHVREISDPITQIVSQVHKLVFLSQLPPSPTPSMRRLLVEQYKRVLFGSSTPPALLKTEMHRLVTGANEPVQLLSESFASDRPSYQPRMVNRALSELAECISPKEVLNPLDSSEECNSITYEQLQAIVDSLLAENGYYQATQSTESQTIR